LFRFPCWEFHMGGVELQLSVSYFGMFSCINASISLDE
jgi:hypothetical protein